MPRSLRILPAGSVVHVVNRGNDRRVLFESVRDFEEFLGLLAWAKRLNPMRILAYCLMPNHWHLVLWPETDDAVPLFMHRLTTTHAVRRRRLTFTVGQGHIYQDRYHSSVIDSEAYYWNAMRYVEANARRACLVKSSAKWRWSSHFERLGRPRDILDEGPFRLPDGWTALVDTPLPDSTVAEIRRALLKQSHLQRTEGIDDLQESQQKPL